jgi:hypothetical protein
VTKHVILCLDQQAERSLPAVSLGLLSRLRRFSHLHRRTPARTRRAGLVRSGQRFNNGPEPSSSVWRRIAQPCSRTGGPGFPRTLARSVVGRHAICLYLRAASPASQQFGAAGGSGAPRTQRLGPPPSSCIKAWAAPTAAASIPPTAPTDLVPLRDEQGIMTGVVAVMRDVTVRFAEMKAPRQQLANRSA